MKKILLTISIFLLSTSMMAQGKIGYVSVDIILSNSKSFVSRQAALEKNFKKDEDSLRQQADNLSQLIAEYNEIANDLSPDEKQLRVDKITTQEQTLQARAVKLRRNLELAQTEILTEYQDKINSAIKQFATKNNYQLILYKDIAYAADSINITDEISALIGE